MARQPKRTTPPDIERHDEVYFRHKTGPQVGKVLARGADGVTLEHGGARHQVGYADVLGHKVKIGLKAKVADSGEDGFIAEDESGRRRFIRDAEETGVSKPLAKAVVLLAPRRIG